MTPTKAQSEKLVGPPSRSTPGGSPASSPRSNNGDRVLNNGDKAKGKCSKKGGGKDDKTTTPLTAAGADLTKNQKRKAAKAARKSKQ